MTTPDTSAKQQVRELLDRKTDARQAEPDGTTALAWAVHHDLNDAVALRGLFLVAPDDGSILVAALLTAVNASSGPTWAATTSRFAVSRASPRPMGLKGSCRLSPPAATVTPLSRRTLTGVMALGTEVEV